MIFGVMFDARVYTQRLEIVYRRVVYDGPEDWGAHSAEQADDRVLERWQGGRSGCQLLGSPVPTRTITKIREDGFIPKTVPLHS